MQSPTMLCVGVLLLCLAASRALPLPDELDSEETRKVLGSSVVTSVSVIMDLGNGSQALFTNGTESHLEKPGGLGSPVDMATPDHYQYYSFDGSGNLIKRYMTKDDVSSIIATSHKHKNTDAPVFYHSVPENLGEMSFDSKQDEDAEKLQESQLRVVANVQNLLKSQISSQGHVRPPMPTHINPEATASWSMILPSFFGNQEAVDAAMDHSHSEQGQQTATPITSTESVSHSTESTTTVKQSESTTPLTPTTKRQTTTTPAVEESSSESQMLGDAPLNEPETPEQSTELSSSTESEPSLITVSLFTTEDKVNSQSTDTESTETNQSTEKTAETSSTIYEIISSSNVSSTSASPVVRVNNTQPSSSETPGTSFLTTTEEYPQSTDILKSEIVNKTQTNESSSTVTETVLASTAANETDSFDSSAMLGDAPAIDLTYKHSLTNHDDSQENPSGSTEDLNESTPESGEQEQPHDSHPSAEETDAEPQSSTSDEQVQSASEEVSQQYEETAAASANTESAEVDSSSSTEHIEEGSGDQPDGSTDNSQVENSVEKQSDEEVNSSTGSQENTDNIEEQIGTDSTENVEDSVEQEHTHSSEVTENTKEEASTVSDEDINEEPSAEVSSSVKTNLKTGTSSHSVEIQADSPHIDKLGEHPHSDLATALILSEENHSSFNQVDQSSSSSKEKVSLKKNDTISETTQLSTQENTSLGVTHGWKDDTTPSSSQVKDEVPESVVNSSDSDNSTDTSKTDIESLASSEEPNVSSSPVKTTDTSSSTPEVTEEEVNSETSSEQSTEVGGSDEEIQSDHNLEESLASIVSQITSENINAHVSQSHLNPEGSVSDEKIHDSGLSSAIHVSHVIPLEGQTNSSTVTTEKSASVNTSTYSPLSETVDPFIDQLNEEGSGVNSLCGEDASCTTEEDGVLDDSEENSDKDKVSAGSESVGITATVDRHGDSSTTVSTTNDDEQKDGANTVSLVQATSSTHGDQTPVTRNPLLGSSSTLDGDSEETVLMTTDSDLTRTDADTTMTTSTLLSESGEIIPISAESDTAKVDETPMVKPSSDTKKVCNKEGSGSDDTTDSCEDNGDGMESSGNGPDSVEGSGESTTNSYSSTVFIRPDGHPDEDIHHSGSGDGDDEDDGDGDDLHDIMKYATSTKDIGVTKTPDDDSSTSNATSNESPIGYHDDLEELHDIDELFDSSTVEFDSDTNETTEETSNTSSTKPVHVMDIFEYINSNVDMGITGVYNSSESESVTEISVTEPGINSNETSDEDLANGPNLIKFKYVNSDEGDTTVFYNETNTSTEEMTSTSSNETEATTTFNVDAMMNEQPVDSAIESSEASIPYNETESNPPADKFKVTTYRPVPQKAQKDDTVGNVKQKPNVVPSVQHQKLKTQNNTQSEDNNWTKVEVIPPHLKKNTTVQYYSPSTVDLQPPPQESLGLEASTVHLVEDVQQFAELCNELAFKLWLSMTEKSVTASRSLVMSPFAITSLLSMIFLGAKGSTSDQMNDVLKLDDMMTFNPHQVFRNVTESVVQTRNAGVRTAAFVRELYSDKSKGPLLEFYKQRASQFYDGLVEEANFTTIGDLLRRRTNLQVKKQTGGRVPEYLRGNSLSLQPPLAAFSANIFQTDCRGASTQGRDGEMYFTILPTTRQRRLVPIPSAVLRTGFLAGYEPGLDATVVSLGMQDSAISTLFVMPGQQGQTAPGDGLSRLEARLLGAAYSSRGWSRLLRSLLPRHGLEVQFPRFSHRSLLNLTASLQNMGVNELFNPLTADLQGLSGLSTAFHVSDLVQINTFTTCGEEVIGSRHHVEIYPSGPQRAGRDSEQEDLASVPLVSRPRQARVEPALEGTSFEEAVPQAGVYHMPLALRPRQARLPDSEQPLPRLKFDRPFLYFVRHNPTGFILHMGRFNPRLIH